MSALQKACFKTTALYACQEDGCGDWCQTLWEDLHSTFGEVMNSQYHQIAHIFTCVFVFLCLPSGENPSWSHIMAASSLLNCHSDWQTVPHALLKHTSTLPVTYSRALPLSTLSGGDASLISPSVQFEGKTSLPAIVARAR